jgi:hypothetical protein
MFWIRCLVSHLAELFVEGEGDDDRLLLLECGKRGLRHGIWINTTCSACFRQQFNLL